LYQATQRATRKGRVAAGKAVKARLPLRRKFIDDPDSRDAAIKSEFDRNAQTGKVVTTYIGVPLSEFPHRESKKGVSVSIDSTRPRLDLRHAFTATVRSKSQIAAGSEGHKGIFTRKKIDRAVQNWFENWWGRPVTAEEMTRWLTAGYGPGTTTGTRSTERYAGRGAFSKSTGFAWRLPIQERVGPSVFSLVKQDEILKPIVANIANLFHKEFDGQISRFTTGKYKSLASVVAEFGGIAADTDQA
jgi:hypothetical protein